MFEKEGRLSTQRASYQISPAERVRLAEQAFGGRAVGSVVESHVVNPLARELLTGDQAGAFLVTCHGADAWGHHLDVKRI